MKSIPFDLVVAKSLNHGIGVNGRLPWHLPADMKMFKKITCSGAHQNTVIMGRKTYESVGKPLPNRLNIVVSRNNIIKESQNLKQARSLEDALALSQSVTPEGRKFVIGGSKLFEDSYDSCRYSYETFINKQVPCDAFMPKHNLTLSYISKTQRHQDYIYDYRLFYNAKKYGRPHPDDNLFGEPEHQQYQYLRMIRNIIQNGDQKGDRTGTGTRTIFGGMMKYDLTSTFPLLTYKKVFWRGVVEELLWFISGSTNAKLLEQKNIHIWDGNSSREYLRGLGLDRAAGDLGPVYGFQWRHWNAPYSTFDQDYQGKGIDQLKFVIEEIKRNPNSRRLIMTAWNPGQLHLMALPPCHLLCQFQVTSSGRLNCIMYQRSCDMGLGVPFNIASYALLTCMIAQVTGLQPGEFTHMMADMHVYNNHVGPLQEVADLHPHPFPYLELNPQIKNIDGFRFEDVKLKGYTSHPKINMKMSV